MSVTIHQKKSWLWAVQSPDDIDEKKVIGRKLLVKDDNGIEKHITVVDIKPNLRHVLGLPKHKKDAPLYQVTDGLGNDYLVSTIRVFAAISEENIPEQEIKDFESLLNNTEFDVVPPGNRHQRRGFMKKNGIWRN